MPSCPPGTVQVGIISVKGPDGEEGCVICEECEPVEDLDCYDCCPPESLALGYRCVPVWEHRMKLVSDDRTVETARLTTPTLAFSVEGPFTVAYATSARLPPASSIYSCHVPEQTVGPIFSRANDSLSSYYFTVTYLGESCYGPCSF